jgi:PilZ domain
MGYDKRLIQPQVEQMEKERRWSARYPFIAHGELIDETTRTRLKTRVSDICKEGCYVDMVNPLPSGTPVHLTIHSGDATFQARGKIVYAVDHLGAGVSFDEIPPESRPLLERWLAEAQKNH